MQETGVTITDILDELGVEYSGAGEHHHAHEDWINIDCPFCGAGEGNRRYGICLTSGRGNCYVCGPIGTAYLLGEALGRPYREMQELTGRFDSQPYTKRPRGNLVVPGGVGDMTSYHKNYLRSRGFDPAELEKLWKVRGIGLASRLCWRLFIPIHADGRVVSWTTRSCDDGQDQRRYWSAADHEEEVSHKEVLYGEDYCRNAVIVHEGSTDVWATGPGSAATFGVGVTASQRERIRKYPVRVVCFDNEPEAQITAKHLCNYLANYPGRTVNVVLSAKDSAEATQAERDQLRRTAGMGPYRGHRNIRRGRSL